MTESVPASAAIGQSAGRPTGPSSAASGKTSLNSLERGLRILSYVQDHGPVAVAEVVSDLAIPTSSAYRYTAALVAQGYLVEMDGQLVASERLAERASSTAARLSAVSRSALDELSKDTGLSVALTTRVHTAAICLSARRVNHAIIAHRQGQALALNAGASATPLLAFAPRPIRERVLASRLMAFTPHTPRRRELAVVVEQIRAEGHHVSHGWLTPGMAAAGVPVVVSGECVAALSLIGREYQLSDEARLVAALKAAAHGIGRLAQPEVPTSTAHDQPDQPNPPNHSSEAHA